MINSNKLFLPGLNGIRAIAAIAVIISHTNGSLQNFGLEKARYLDLAGFGVTMFFSLSGFLITYLLLIEKKQNNSIDIKKFYLRRVLRIWPLYYLYLIIIFLIYKYANIGNVYFLYLALLPNFVNLFIGEFNWQKPSHPAMFNLGHYWSLGVEEQFYAIWPWIISKVKNLFIFLLCFPLVFLSIKIAFTFLHFPAEVQNFLHYSRFGCLALGGLGAYLYFNDFAIIKFLQQRYVEVFAWIILLIISVNKFHIFSIIDHEIVTVITFIIIVNQLKSTSKLVNLENTIFDYLGKISFGLYVFNPLVISTLAFVYKYITFDKIENTLLKNCLVYLSVLTLNIVIAHISYHYFEKWFLKFKSKFTTIESSSSNPKN
jgi:peptidoglycan/LPS O-acetylase OafA/YrhL